MSHTALLTVEDKLIVNLLGFDNVCTDEREMARKLTLTVFPCIGGSQTVKSFAEQLMSTLIGFGVQFLPFEQALSGTNKKRLKKHVSVLAIGPQSPEHLPINYISSLSDNSIIQILDFPEGISKTSSFGVHFETAIRLFARHLVNIVIGVDEQKWILYNFNASHPVYDRAEGFAKAVLHSLVPKVFAPISPLQLSEFEILDEKFDPLSDRYLPFTMDIVEAGRLFAHTGLFPKGKSFDELEYASAYHRRIVKAHLDNRNGMSYGFLARQLPSLKGEGQEVQVLGQTIHLPMVWVITQRSGSDKTRFDPYRDLVKIGIERGKLYLQAAIGADLEQDYRPSFDTMVILAHAIGNHIVASLLPRTSPFATAYFSAGMGLAHWHGYFRPDLIPPGYVVYGQNNPNVACSSPQSAFFALKGKLESFRPDFCGDIHVEPQHGVNVTTATLTALGRYLIENPQASALGNLYWQE